MNAVTVKDAYTMLRFLSKKWFGTLDLCSAYWQVPLDLASSGKAAFETTSGLYEWTVMPFGVTSSPRTLIWSD